MTASEIAIPALPILSVAVWFGIFAYRRGLKNLRRELSSRADESGGYDDDGNHIYYDRKYIRRRQNRNRKEEGKER